ncbi:unnamed protein product [Aphanomyces euteiches]
MTGIAKSALIALALAMASPAEATKYKNVVYYVEWAIYARNFNIFDMDWSKVTHINYAFGKPTVNNTVAITDSWASLEKKWPDHGDSTTDSGNNLYGNLGQAFKQKLQNRGTKMGLSLGGWSLSDQFSRIASSTESRKTFVKSAVKLMEDVGLDFIDIDWEYPVEGGNDIPHSPDDIANLVLLLQDFRDEFKTLPFKAELSVASPAGPEKYRHWDFPAICGLLDFINIMNYDFSGSFSNYTDHHANLYLDPNHPPGDKFSAHRAVQDYINGGCPSEKIVFGIPAYGHSFENTTGLYANFSQPTNGSWGGLGTWDYKVLPQAGATEYYDEKVGATYSYDPVAKTFISYEGPMSLAQKLDYIKKYNLGGTMFWVADADLPSTNPRSLITQVYNYFGKENMAFYDNNLNYPTSQYDNIRNALTTAAPTTSAAPVTSEVTPAPTSTTTSTDAPVTTTETPDYPTLPTTTDAPVTTTETPGYPTLPATTKKAPTTTPKKTTTKAPRTPKPTKDVCRGKNNVCLVPGTRQSVDYCQTDCEKLSFTWCP